MSGIKENNKQQQLVKGNQDLTKPQLRVDQQINTAFLQRDSLGKSTAITNYVGKDV